MLRGDFSNFVSRVPGYDACFNGARTSCGCQLKKSLASFVGAFTSVPLQNQTQAGWPAKFAQDVYKQEQCAKARGDVFGQTNVVVRGRSEIDRRQNVADVKDGPAVGKNNHVRGQERDHQDRNWRVPKDSLCDRSKEQTSVPAETMGPHHDQVGLFFRRALENFRVWLAGTNGIVRHGRPVGTGHELQHVMGLLPFRLPLEVFLAALGRGCFNHETFVDGQYREMCLVSAGQADREAERLN
jgi:hypothetical protein